ncbi:MAG: shikimate dehydrogenase [Candidatus Neomarinimicrobiota bacterium]|nr:shikimate dehydrogenase [Candidatus Neomarinimicrobiota bacterium]
MKLGLIGNPVDQSISPELQRILFDVLNLQGYTYEKNDISHEELSSFFDAFKAGSFDGINITIPHKENGLQFVDELDEKAEILGNINCIKKTGEHLKGYNTDFYGFQMMLCFNNIDIASKHCLVLGAGGSSKTIIKALSDGKAGSITVKNKSIENALKIQSYAKSRMNLDIRLFDDADKAFDVVINTTPLGMYEQEDKNDFFTIPLHSDSVLIDLIYTAKNTLFLEKHRTQVKQCINGLDMLIFQAIKSIEIWTETTYNVSPQLDSIKKQLENVLC